MAGWRRISSVYFRMKMGGRRRPIFFIYFFVWKTHHFYRVPSTIETIWSKPIWGRSVARKTWHQAVEDVFLCHLGRYLEPLNLLCRYLNHWTCIRRAKTHERFYMIEVHRHRFARHARKVSFEKCEHWRKVCERSAKDQIVSILYNELVISLYEFSILENATPMGPRKQAKDLRKGSSWELLFSTTFNV